MNIVILTGNLVDKPEFTVYADDKKIATCCLAVRRDFNKEETDFINLVAFNRIAEYLEKYAHKGDKCEIQGRWQVSKWEDKEGKTRFDNDCIVSKIVCFKKALSRDERAEKKESEETVEVAEDDLPF